jgi:HlyD family secretion protein
MKKKVIVSIIVVLALSVTGFFALRNRDKGPMFKTEKISRGNIRTMVTATGTVNAVQMILVGTQVSGTIKELYADYNSPVEQNQLLAQIDPATFEAQVEQAKANLFLARANLEKMDTSLVDAKRTLERSRSLFAKNFIAQSDLDTSDTNHQSYTAQVKASRAQVAQAQAALKLSETNLKYTRILSPVNGTVISRNVDVGQTVAASFQTPTLFSIAKDLTKMQIDTSVDEADIGNIRLGQPVEFTVDAYPNTTFKGKVSEIRNAPTTIQNVVTYDVVIKVDNPDFKLKPGMTANVSIITADKNDVLRVPNTALRFRFSDTDPRASQQKGQGIWVMASRTPKFIGLTPGISDGNYTEIASDNVKEEQEVITDLASNKKKDSSPFGRGFMR